jgi:hypothetical protein
MSARALRALERVQAARQVATSHGRSLSTRSKSAILRFSRVSSVNEGPSERVRCRGHSSVFLHPCDVLSRARTSPVTVPTSTFLH